MNELIIEIYSEDIPISMQELGSKILLNIVIKKLNFIFNNILIGKYFYTSRRIGFVIFHMPKKIRKKRFKIRGPKIHSSIKYILSFKKKYNINNLYINNNYYYYVILIKNNRTIVLLKIIFNNIINNFPWPQTMRWNNYDIKWIRPIHYIFCIFKKQILSFQYGHIKTNNFIKGNWVYNNNYILINNYKKYYIKLKKYKVFIFFKERLNILYKIIRNYCEKVLIKPIYDFLLLKELSNLTELPLITMSKIEKNFLYLPKKILIFIIQNHQKYLMTINSTNILKPYFFLLYNSINTKNHYIIYGHILVLKSKLIDINFFLKQDIFITLIDHLSLLGKIIYHNQFGNYIKKINKMNNITKILINKFYIYIDHIYRIIYLFKNDLALLLCIELINLSGIIGYYYSLIDNEIYDISFSIKQQYLFTKENLHKLSMITILIKNIISLNIMFQLFIKFSGSKDPYSIKRIIHNTLKIIYFYNLNIPLCKLLNKNLIKFIKNKLKYFY